MEDSKEPHKSKKVKNPKLFIEQKVRNDKEAVS